MPNTKKVAIVNGLKQKIEQSKNIALVSIDATKHTSLEKLRKELKKSNASVHVAKNSLLTKAIEGVGDLSDFGKTALPIKNNTALVSLGSDWANAIKFIYEFAKKETTIFFKSAFLDNTAYDKSAIETIAKLPTKKELLGKVIGSIKSPVYRLDTAIKYPMTYFVNVLKAQAQKISTQS
jgi:large subunit ribosomal protein L10